MAHHRETHRLRDLERHLERRHPGGAARLVADTHLDADHEIAVFLRDLPALAEVEQADIGALAHHHARTEREDARERDVEIGQNPHGRGLDHMPAEAQEIARTRGTGIDEGGRAAAAPQ